MKRFRLLLFVFFKGVLRYKVSMVALKYTTQTVSYFFSRIVPLAASVSAEQRVTLVFVSLFSGVQKKYSILKIYLFVR